MEEDGRQGMVLMRAEEEQVPFDRGHLSSVAPAPLRAVGFQDKVVWRKDDVQLVAYLFNQSIL
jgi:hypothetical protein